MKAAGIGVGAVRDGDVLFGLRRGAHGAGTWSFPGGHLPLTRAPRPARELDEESGLEAVNPRIVGETDDGFAEGLRYRIVFVRVDWAGGEPIVREPHACERWGWFSWDEPPQRLFLPLASLRATRFRP